MTKKRYKCKECGDIQEIETNHFGECYNWGHYNACKNWGCRCASSPNYNPTVWICLDKEPKS